MDKEQGTYRYHYFDRALSLSVKFVSMCISEGMKFVNLANSHWGWNMLNILILFGSAYYGKQVRLFKSYLPGITLNNCATILDIVTLQTTL